MNKNTLQKEIDAALKRLHGLNPDISGSRRSDRHPESGPRPHRLQKVLVANRGEIAKRFFLALHEEGIPSVAAVTDPDRGQSWYEFADEVIFIGDQYHYASIPVILAATLLGGANAVYSGYGFLSENADFVEAIEKMKAPEGTGIIFMGPDHTTMRSVGNKIEARRLARRHGIPLFESSEALDPDDIANLTREGERIGYPVVLKLSSGGGGRGVLTAEDEISLIAAAETAARIGRELYDDPTFYIERFIRNPVHFEVQIFNGLPIGIRKCAVQRRHQKIIEESGHAFLSDTAERGLLDAAEEIARLSGYSGGGGAGTVEFLIDTETGRFGFMEMNTRLQVEYAVTDQSLGIDLAKWQILFFDGRESEIIGFDRPADPAGATKHSIECRIYAEEPESDYLPSPGKIVELDLPTFNGIRCDFGFMEGDSILPMYDPMIGKLIAHGATRREAMIRLERALQELYIGGVKTNIGQLLRIMRHPAFMRGDYTNNLLEAHPELRLAGPERTPSAHGDRRHMKQILFGAFTEHLRFLQHSVNEFVVIARLGSILDVDAASGTASRYAVEHRGQRLLIDFIQTGIDTFYAFVNGLYNGKIVLTSMNDRCDDFLLIFGSSSYRVRANRHQGFIELRMKDDSNKINYYRLNVAQEGAAEESRVRKICSPFQGTFISFCRDLKPGDLVREGEPLIVLSSMKMETVIASPASGRVISLIEDGDASRLQFTRTPGGRVAGRSVQEGELLALIEPTGGDHGDDAAPAPGGLSPAPLPAPDSLLDRLFSDDFSDAVIEDPARHFKTAIELLNASAFGYLHHPSLVESLKKTVRRVPADIDASLITDDVLDLMNSLILHHTNIKKLFSPVVSGEGLSLLEELDHHIAGGRENTGQPSRAFEQLMKTVVESYGISRWEERSEMSVLAHHHVFLLLRRAYQFSLDQTDIIKKIVHIISNIRRPGRDTLLILSGLMEQEEAERDDSLLKFLKNILASQFDEADLAALRERELAPAVKNLYVSFRERFTEGIAALCADSLNSPPGDPGAAPSHRLHEGIAIRIGLLEKSWSARRLYSPMEAVWPYRLESRNDPERRAFIVFTRADATSRAGAPAASLAEALQVAALYRQMAPSDDCWIEVLTNGIAVSWDDENAPGTISCAEMRSIFASSLPLRKNGGALRCIVDIDIRLPFSGSTRRRNLLVYRDTDTVCIEFLLPMDRTNPYHLLEEVTIPNQRLLDTGKWPVEVWAEECFDPGTMREIRIASIDETSEASPSGLRIISRPAGAKIYYGEINGLPACFYMKDSRVSGGSTGSREGLKYVAAAYLSYMHDWPLYVWNDSAGANIMEGVISLNRGAQGFMINALLTARSDDETLRRYIDHAADPELKRIIGGLDAEYGLPRPGVAGGRRSFQLTAVGIGSSAGLDVYGSSQASIQMLLDSEESYRVLTGSKVVHTVIGEEITNYDIGGAKILGTWTGIVDIIAPDKLHLLASIHLAQGIFSSSTGLTRIRRAGPREQDDSKEAGPIVLNESMIRDNVDDGTFWPFKESYYAAEALIGGFALIGGRRVLIMGPRTHAGLRSPAAVIKARELLRTAHRTSSHQILIFGARWHQTPAIHELMQMRPRIDFMNTVMKPDGLQFHIVTHPGGLKCFEINSRADALIYVRNGRETAADSTFAQKNAGFIVDSLTEAFDLAHRLISKIDPIDGAADFTAPAGNPAMPHDAAEPYDIVESLILHAFDEGSFIEFFRDMNNPITGPNLITGLAGLAGRTVGVIADQPLLKGGGADAFGTEKFRVFTEFLDRNAIPLVMLSNSSGFVPGSQQERQRIQAIGAESLDANILSTMPVVSVTLNQNYGGRLIHAYNRFLRPGIVYLALEKAVMAVIGVEAAFDLLYGKRYARLLEKGERESAEELNREFSGNYIEKARASNDGIESGLVDWVIPSVADLREHLLRGLALAFRRCNEAFGAKWPDR